MMRKLARGFLFVCALTALGVVFVGVQGFSPCPEPIYTGVEAYLLNAREIRVEGKQQALSSHQITLTTAPAGGNKTDTDPDLQLIIRDADGALLAIGGGRR
jgi:hypothetical protein